MARLSEIKDKIYEKIEILVQRVRESEFYIQLKSKYDELDSERKVYIKLGIALLVTVVLVSSVVFGMLRVSALHDTLAETDALINYLNQSSDTLRYLKEKQLVSGTTSSQGNSLDLFVQEAMSEITPDEEKISVSKEIVTEVSKTISEKKVEVKLSEINLRQLSRAFYSLISKGAPRGVAIGDLSIQAKDDMSGWLNASFLVSELQVK